MSAEAIIGLIFGVVALCGTLVGCTWALCVKINQLVTQDQCKERRSACPCAAEVRRLKVGLGVKD